MPVVRIRAVVNAATFTAGLDRAGSNGYTNKIRTAPLKPGCARRSQSLSPACQGLPVGAFQDEYIRVKIVWARRPCRVIGWNSVTSAVTAISHAKLVVPPHSSMVPLWPLSEPDGNDTARRGMVCRASWMSITAAFLITRVETALREINRCLRQLYEWTLRSNL